MAGHPRTVREACKIHLAADGKGRPLGFVLTAGHAADTTFFEAVLETTA